MSLIEEIGELSLVCAGQKARIEELEELLREYYEMVDEYLETSWEMMSYPKMKDLQQRAQPMLEEGKPR